MKGFRQGAPALKQPMRNRFSVQLQRTLSSSRTLLVLLTVVALAATWFVFARSAGAQSTGTAQKTDNVPTGNAKNGRVVYTNYGCYECHGLEAQGGAGTGPRLGPPPLPFSAFAFQLRSPRDQMPPYTAKVLSDAELADIYAFIRSLPPPPKVESIPLLR